MAAKALARLAETYIEDGQYGDAMRVIQLAAIPADEAGLTRMAAFLNLLEAAIHGNRDNSRAVELAIGHAQDHYANADNSLPFRMTRFLIDETLHKRIALAYSHLAEHDASYAARAADVAATAARSCPDSEPCTLLLAQVPLALNDYRSGNIDVANETTEAILTALPEVSSRRLTARLGPLAAEAATHGSTATDLAHQLTMLSR